MAGSFGIDSMEYGFDYGKFGDYLQTIQAVVLTGMEDVLNTGVGNITAACNDNWGGKSKDAFVKNLTNDVNKIKDLYQKLYLKLQGTLADVQGSMAAMDKGLITSDE